MNTMHCTLENGADLYVNERQKYDTIVLGLLKKEEKEESQIASFYFVGAYVTFRYIAMLYIHSIGNQP